MKEPSVFRRIVVIVCVAAWWSSLPVISAEFYNLRTNYVDTPITNLIEVRMPRPVFVNHYRTNWVEQTRTNVHVVDRFRTNFVDAFRTNLVTLHVTNDVAVQVTHTNFVEAYKTNVDNLMVTNEVAVNLVRTNVVDVYRTNWQTVVQTQTNWLTQKTTNVVHVDAARPVLVQPSSSSAQSVASTATISKSASADEPVIEVSRTSKPPENNVVEVELKVRWPADTADAPPVAQWRIESENGSVLSFGTDQEFRKDLPVGNYKVEAKLQRDADSPSFLLRGTLTVTIREAVVQQRTNRTKLAAN